MPKKAKAKQDPNLASHEHIAAMYWLRYAETALKEEVTPSLFSSHPAQWIIDACAQAQMKRPPSGEMRIVIDRATEIIVKTLYYFPLQYPHTTQFMIRRAFSH